MSLQVETLQNFLTQKPDGILLAAIDLNAVAPVLKQARKKGIVVTTFDADAATDARDMFVNQMSYEQAAKTMLDCALIERAGGRRDRLHRGVADLAQPYGAHQDHDRADARATRSTRCSRSSTRSSPPMTTPRATTSR